MASSAGLLVPNAQQQFLDNNGTPIAGGFVYMYVPGTTTPNPTWSDPLLTVLNTNPILLDQGGRCQIWAAPNTLFRQIVTDANNNMIWDQQTGVQLNNVTLGNVVVNGSLTATGPILGSTVSALGDMDALGNITGANLDTAGAVTAAGGISSPTTINGGALIAGSGGATIGGGGITTTGLVATGDAVFEEFLYVGSPGGPFYLTDTPGPIISFAPSTYIGWSGSAIFTVVGGFSGLQLTGGGIGFLGNAAIARQTVTGSRGSATPAVLEDLLQVLQLFGLIIDGTTP